MENQIHILKRSAQEKTLKIIQKLTEGLCLIDSSERVGVSEYTKTEEPIIKDRIDEAMLVMSDLAEDVSLLLEKMKEWQETREKFLEDRPDDIEDKLE